MMRQLVYAPAAQQKMTIAVGVSGSGTNFERIYEAAPWQRYVVFSNAPECGGVENARDRKLKVIAFDSKNYFEKGWNITKVPRRGVERNCYDRELFGLVEEQVGDPDLVCLAGYDLWMSDFAVDRYFPRILNVHPGDTTRGYTGFGWVPTAKAILAGDTSVKSTLFFVDKTDDGGPVLIQSASLRLSPWEKELDEIRNFATGKSVKTMKQLQEAVRASDRRDIPDKLKAVSGQVQDKLKMEGDWRIYPFAVHELIGRGRVEIDGNGIVYIDGVTMPPEGYQVDRYGFTNKIERWV